jgi:hypothetical protein
MAADESPVRLLAGGNPQIPKGEGDAVVQRYLDAIPADRQALARRVDELITAHVPGVRKAVKWNSPLYGGEPGGWFLSMHVMTRYVKVALFRGAHLSPLPPVASREPEVRYLHLGVGEEINEPQLIAWIQQAAVLPGEAM